MASAMSFPPDFDDHLLEAGHDGCRAEVSKVGHPIARAEAQCLVSWFPINARNGRRGPDGRHTTLNAISNQAMGRRV